MIDYLENFTVFLDQESGTQNAKWIEHLVAYLVIPHSSVALLAPSQISGEGKTGK